MNGTQKNCLSDESCPENMPFLDEEAGCVPECMSGIAYHNTDSLLQCVSVGDDCTSAYAGGKFVISTAGDNSVNFTECVEKCPPEKSFFVDTKNIDKNDDFKALQCIEKCPSRLPFAISQTGGNYMCTAACPGSFSVSGTTHYSYSVVEINSVYTRVCD